jgi:hypothetical protein
LPTLDRCPPSRQCLANARLAAMRCRGEGMSNDAITNRIFVTGSDEVLIGGDDRAHHGEPPWLGGGAFSRLRSRLGSTTDEHAEARRLRREITEFRPIEILENTSRYRRRVPAITRRKAIRTSYVHALRVANRGCSRLRGPGRGRLTEKRSSHRFRPAQSPRSHGSDGRFASGRPRSWPTSMPSTPPMAQKRSKA